MASRQAPPQLPRGRWTQGSIEVITGSMFSGKTEELIRRVKRAAFARQKIQAFKPRIDDRYNASQIVSHASVLPGPGAFPAAAVFPRGPSGGAEFPRGPCGAHPGPDGLVPAPRSTVDDEDGDAIAGAIPAVAVGTSDSLEKRVDDQTQVVAIDEAQFFDRGIVDVVQRLADKGVRVIVAGLDQDYLGRPFYPMPELMAVAEDVTKVHAVCTVCGGEASRSQRLIADAGTVLVGGSESYEARCRVCFEAREIPR